MAKKEFIGDFKVKQSVESLFFVKFISLVTARDGKKYINIILSDKTGDLESRIWNNAQEIADRISKDMFVKASGKVNLYQGRKQFVISKIEQIEKSEIEEVDFVKGSPFDPEKQYTKLLELVAKLDDVYIRDLLQAVLGDEEIIRRLKKWQAGKTIHHAYQGGLLDHIVSCVELSLWLSAHYRVNKNYVVAGAILHDLCKIYELTDDINVEYTEEGKLVGHLVKGVELVDRFSYRIKSFPYNLKIHLKHILLAHHGSYEFGSPKIPQTKEAYLLHLVDYMDSKMHSMDTAIAADQNTGRWTNFVRHLDRIVYKEELPFYPEYVTEAASRKGGKRGSPAKKELKQNLGKLLEDYKIE